MVIYKHLIEEKEYLPTNLDSIKDVTLLDVAISAISRLEKLTGEEFVYARVYSKFHGWMSSQPIPKKKEDTLDVFISERYNKSDLVRMKNKLEENIL